jgi:AcrR family transcriptional regulator
MVRPSKKKQIPNLQEAIKETAWKQAAEHGASALSLRAIARELKITAPAIYNYFPDRDALVTALIMDAYMSFGDWQFQGRDSAPPGHHAERLKGIGMAYRNWAHTHPQRYQLIFGTPIPGYVYPAETVFPASSHAILPLFSVVDEARLAGRLKVKDFAPVKKEYQGHFELWKTQIGSLHPQTHFVAMLVWSRVHGIVSLEIQGNLPPFGEDGNALFLAGVDFMINEFIKE